tara:strand:+ start:88 stop:270 length:183 start_codon:yes stop_codon:yes gene_type:complete
MEMLMAKLKKPNSVNQHNPHLAGDYSIEDKKNVINFQQSGRKTPKPHELDSLHRQYGKKV